jgi:hypothetical protein
MADVIGALKKIAPWMGAAVATAMPGPIGGVAVALTKALSTPEKPVTVEPTVDAISSAVQTAFGDPAQVAAIKKADQDFSLAWQAAGFKHEDDLEGLAVDDRKDARAMRTANKDWTPTIGFFLLLTGFFTMLVLLCKFPIPNENKATVYTMVGSLGTLVIMAATFFYGTTRDSGRKTELLAQAQPVDTSNS